MGGLCGDFSWLYQWVREGRAVDYLVVVGTTLGFCVSGLPIDVSHGFVDGCTCETDWFDGGYSLVPTPFHDACML